jgi:DNA polymerase I
MKQAYLGLEYPSFDKWPEGYTFIEDLKTLRRCFDSLPRVNGMDIETTDLNMFDPRQCILSVAIATAPGKGFGFYVGHNPSKVALVGLEALRRMMAEDTTMFVGHYLKFDLKFLMQKCGIPDHELNCMIYDTQVANYFLHEEEKYVSLETLVSRYRLRYPEKYDDLPTDYKQRVDRKKMEMTGMSDLLLYNIRDADASLRLRLDLNKDLEEQNLMGVINASSQVYPVIIKMENRGIAVDRDYAKKKQGELQRDLVTARLKLKEYAGSTFSPNSNDQVAGILYGKYGYSIPKVTLGGVGSTDYEAIKSLQSHLKAAKQDTSFVDLLLKFKKDFKLNHTYYNKIPSWLQRDGRVHSTFNITGTETNRLSSEKPNMQNQKRGSDFRGIFVPTEGYVFLEWDFAQIEMRIIAELAKEPRMLKMFADGLDIHTAVLCDIYKQDYEQMVALLKDSSNKEYMRWKNLRVGIKNINFGIAYGATAERIQRELAKNEVFWSVEECELMLSQWKEQYPNIVAWKKGVEKFVVQYKEIVMPFGSRRRLPLADFKTGEGRHALREAVNFIIQSTAGWYTLINMVLVDHYFSGIPEIDGHVILSVHDSILCEIRTCSHNRMKQIMDDIRYISTRSVKDYIRNVFNFSINVPLEIDLKLLNRWE